MKVTINEEILGTALIGAEAENPVTKTKIPLLPASFVAPKGGTGVVMSVPAHAPYDYQALKDLEAKPDLLKQYGLSPESIRSILIPVIVASEGYEGGVPSEQIIRKMDIQSQADPKLEAATADLYRHEFHVGRMTEGTGAYQGLSVPAARDKVKADMLSSGVGKISYEIMNKPVVCRCGTECIVKIFENQWFIDYSKHAWKDLAHSCLDQMSLLPEDIRTEFEYTINWLKQKACARKSGLGTRLPWDQEWIIESLSDSVIYMTYYLVSKYVNELGVKADQLGLDVFDYIFLGEGDEKTVAEKNRLDLDVLKQMRGEFEYFYPLDSRHSGRDLVPNHLTFFIFNHAAIFPEQYWPRQIVVNGSVLMEGKKMSKSFGNIIPLRSAVQQYGADPLRMAILATAELLQDADMSLGLIRTFRERLERLYDSVIWAAEKHSLGTKMSDLRVEDRWMLSRVQGLVEEATKSIEKLRVREAIQTVVYTADQDVQWYLRRSRSGSDDSRERVRADVMYQVAQVRVRLVAPFAPFVSEEMWALLGNSEFVSTAAWPRPNPALIDVIAEEGEELIRSLLEDTLNIIRVTKIKPTRVVYYTSAGWKLSVYLAAMRMAEAGSLNVGQLMKQLMEDEELKKHAKEVSSFAKKTVEDILTVPPEIRRRRLAIATALGEQGLLEEAKDFFKRELSAEVSVYSEEDQNRYDPKGRASLSKPYRPAIYVE